MNDAGYQYALLGITFYGILVLWSTNAYLKHRLGKKHDNSLGFIITAFIAWVLASLNDVLGQQDEQEKLTRLSIQYFIISALVNGCFLWSMSFFQPEENKLLGKFYKRIPWRRVAIIVFALTASMFILRFKLGPSVWLDVLLSSIVVLCFTSGMALIFYHRGVIPMAVLSILNGFALVLVQCYLYLSLPEKYDIDQTNLWPVLWNPAWNDFTLGPVLHLVSRAGLVFCILMLSITWLEKQSHAENMTSHSEDIDSENSETKANESENNNISSSHTGTVDPSSKNPVITQNAIHFSMVNGSISITMHLIKWGEPVDLSELSPARKGQLIRFARHTKLNEPIAHGDFTNFAQTKRELIESINMVLRGQNIALLETTDLIIQNTPGTSTLAIDSSFIDLPNDVLQAAGFEPLPD